MNIEDFSQGHIDSAAHLLVDVQRAGSVGLTSVAASLDNATRLISDARQGGLGLAALEGNRVFGFLIARVPNSPGTGGLRISDIHHAADRDRAAASLVVPWNVTPAGRPFDWLIAPLEWPHLPLFEHVQLRRRAHG